MFRVDAGVVTNQGADFFGPIALYASMRANGTIFSRFLKRAPSPFVSAVVVFAGCTAWEWCQRFDLRGTPLMITRGSFDWLDVLAYAAGVAAAWLGELGTLRWSRSV
jgi:hypothetical protein